jgi:catechol 2,3-dioxygenase
MTSTARVQEAIPGTIPSHQGDALESERSPVFIRSATLVTRDAGRLAAFYTDVLGFERIGMTSDSVALGAAGSSFLTLETRADATPFDPRSSGLFHIAYLVPDRTSLARWFVAARAAGARFEGASDHAVSEAFYLTDPDGNGIEVYADRARAYWPRDAGGYVMTTAPMALRELLTLVPAPAELPPKLPAGTRIGHVHLQTGDAERSARFWQDKLGLAETHRRPGARFLSWGGYHHHIALNNWRSSGAGRRSENSAGLAGIEFAVRDEADLARLSTLIGTNGPDGRSLDLCDPDGLDLRFRMI